MLRYILNNLAGYLRIRVEGYSPERFLNLCCYHGIFLWNLRPAKGAYEMNIRVRDFRRLRPMVRKSRAKVRITQKRGVPFFIHKYRGRKLFFTGSVIAICLIFLLSSFIWRIQIDGNLARTDEVLLSFLTEKGIAKERLYKEERSTSTRENLLYSKKIMEEEHLDFRVIIVTNEFHEYRASVIAEHTGITPSAVCGKTAWWLLPTYYLRELYGIVFEWIF